VSGPDQLIAEAFQMRIEIAHLHAGFGRGHQAANFKFGMLQQQFRDSHAAVATRSNNFNALHFKISARLGCDSG